MTKIREAAVAGTFYPANADQLKQILAQYLNDATEAQKVPKAIIAPHAGYIYSGPVAANVYARLQSKKDLIKRVVLLGPSHYIGFNGFAVSSAGQFATPLGNITVDTAAVKKLSEYPFVNILDEAHEKEHSLEMQLPFLQMVLDDFTLVPIVTGNASVEQTSQLIESFWGAADTLIIISSDLSHFHDYETAKKRDKKTTERIEKLQYEQLDGYSACGYIAVSGLLALARKKDLKISTIDLRNSGDTGGKGDKSKVVGYGAYVIE